ncbi:MAG: hypothetical protein QXS96_04485 [Candidatus Caldarchaeum sp.]|uniref:Uncharacterized protein n=1 Tax=Caldiarchaeum subterraneum TaxID=311458 RepID=A0A7C4E1M2_CALS0|nr:hypothetical protein [Candidatus Caldarchaeales archaeon]
MREKSGLAGKIAAELARGLTIYSRQRTWILADLLQWPFWIIFFFLAILMYAPSFLNDPAVMKTISYGFFVFIFVSSFMWNATSLPLEAQMGVVEQLVLTKTPISIHLVSRTIITAADIALGGLALLLLSSLFFGADVSIAKPLHFAAYLAIAFIFFLFFSSIVSTLLLSVKSPWIVTNILQFVVPFSSGAIPVHLLPPEAAAVVSASPFFYILHPIVASATGLFYLPETQMLVGAVAATIVAAVLSVFAEKRLMRRALKTGRFAVL